MATRSSKGINNNLATSREATNKAAISSKATRSKAATRNRVFSRLNQLLKIKMAERSEAAMR